MIDTNCLPSDIADHEVMRALHFPQPANSKECASAVLRAVGECKSTDGLPQVAVQAVMSILPDKVVHNADELLYETLRKDLNLCAHLGNDWVKIMHYEPKYEF